MMKQILTHGTKFMEEGGRRKSKLSVKWETDWAAPIQQRVQCLLEGTGR